MIAIFKREVRSSFHGMIGYVLTAFMLAATAIYFIALNLGYGLTDFGYYTLYRTVAKEPGTLQHVGRRHPRFLR